MERIKKALAKEIAAIITKRGLTQLEAAKLVGDAPSQISLVTCGHLRGFSTDRLFKMYNGLGGGIHIVAAAPLSFAAQKARTVLRLHGIDGRPRVVRA